MHLDLFFHVSNYYALGYLGHKHTIKFLMTKLWHHHIQNCRRFTLIDQFQQVSENFDRCTIIGDPITHVIWARYVEVLSYNQEQNELEHPFKDWENLNNLTKKLPYLLQSPLLPPPPANQCGRNDIIHFTNLAITVQHQHWTGGGRQL